MNDFDVVPTSNIFILLEVFDVDVLQAVLEVEEEFHTEPARPGLLLDRTSPFIREVTALLQCRDSV